MLYKKMILEKENLTKQILDLRKEIRTLPDGKLICSHTGPYIKWFCSDGHKKIYIPKKNRALASNLALKKYLSTKMDALISEVNAIDFYLRHHKESHESMSIFLRTPGYKELLSEHFNPASDELKEWANAPYERSNSHPENLTHKCASGNIVRSKSEMLIDMFLYTHKIPFRYECPLILDGITIYPDFTIKHPLTGSLYYWEHFGLIDEPEYLESALKKLRLYSSNGIIPTIQLIATFESKKSPLGAELIESIVSHYFL